MKVIFKISVCVRMSQQILAVSHRAKSLIIWDDEQPLFGLNVLKHLNQSRTCRARWFSTEAYKGLRFSYNITQCFTSQSVKV